MVANRVVIDPSVAAKWFLPDETGAELADQWVASMFTGAVELVAPQLFYDEVGNALLRAAGAHTPRISKQKAFVFFRELLSWPLEQIQTRHTDRERAFELASRHSKGYYDMVYLALAERLDCQWLTADTKVLKSSGSQFPSHRVALLA